MSDNREVVVGRAVLANWALCITAAVACPETLAQAVFSGESFSDAAVARDQQAFARSCSSCHADDLSAGAFRPALNI